MNEIDNKELDRLIEDAVCENAARKQPRRLKTQSAAMNANPGCADA